MSSLWGLSVSLLERNRAMVSPALGGCQNSCLPIVGTVVNMAATLQDELPCSQVWQTRLCLAGRVTQRWLRGDAAVACSWPWVCCGDRWPHSEQITISGPTACSYTCSHASLAGHILGSVVSVSLPPYFCSSLKWTLPVCDPSELVSLSTVHSVVCLSLRRGGHPPELA